MCHTNWKNVPAPHEALRMNKMFLSIQNADFLHWYIFNGLRTNNKSSIKCKILQGRQCSYSLLFLAERRFLLPKLSIIFTEFIPL